MSIHKQIQIKQLEIQIKQLEIEILKLTEEETVPPKIPVSNWYTDASTTGSLIMSGGINTVKGIYMGPDVPFRTISREI
jgi:hypothetical protein